jgi:hypothetical protein
VNCRYDWHQTSSDVVVSVFAKKYDPDSSFVQLNPVRLKVHLFFPEEQSVFSLDLELYGVRIIINYTIHIFVSGKMVDGRMYECRHSGSICVSVAVQTQNQCFFWF